MESIYESEMSEIILVKAENEDMRDYKAPIMLAMDDHRLHFLEHRAILANPDARKDVQLQSIVSNHCMEHLNQYLTLQQSNPGILAIMGETPLPTPMMPPMPGQMPGAPGAQQPPANQAAMANPANQTQQEAAGVKMPNMPNLPKNADQNTKAAYEQIEAQ